MATITAQVPARSANPITFSAASAGGDKFANTGKEYVIVRNGSGSPVTLTVTTPATNDGLAIADRTIEVAAGATHFLGPWPTGLYNDGDGMVNLSWSLETDMTLAVIRIGS